MKIPPLIHSIFDAFPLINHPNDYGYDMTSNDAYFFHEKASAKSLKRASTLAVNNVRRLDLNGKFKKYIPTDPAGLSVCLIFCRKFDLDLPSGPSNRTSGHCMIPLSYLASPSKELPMVIESDDHSNNYWTDPFQATQHAQLSHLNSSESILHEHLESFKDLWVLILLTSAGESTFSETSFYRDPELLKSTILWDQMEKISKFDVQYWDHFASRLPHLFSASTITPRIINDFFSLQGKKIALQKELQNKLDEFSAFIPLFMSFMKEAEKTPAMDIFELKFVSLVICIKHFLPANLNLSEIIGVDFQGAVKYSEEVLMSF